MSRLFFIPLFRHNGFLSGSEGEIAAWVLLRFCGSIETNENGMIKMCVEIPRGHLFHISIPHSPIFFSLFLFHSSFSFIFFFPHRTFTILYGRANSRSFNFSPPSITSFPLSATFAWNEAQSFPTPFDYLPKEITHFYRCFPHDKSVINGAYIRNSLHSRGDNSFGFLPSRISRYFGHWLTLENEFFDPWVIIFPWGSNSSREACVGFRSLRRSMREIFEVFLASFSAYQSR